MYDICVFAGTSEGRQLVEFLSANGKRVYARTATEYGSDLIPPSDLVTCVPGRLDEAEMETLFRKMRFPLVVDATHPYAALASENIRAACERAGTEYLRLSRGKSAECDGCVYVESIDEAADSLVGTEGNILATTGSKALLPYTRIDDYRERLYARVLPMKSSIEACESAEIPASHIIAMQGPFSHEMNLALIKSVNAKYLVTKDSGETGGFFEKLSAARELGITCVIIGRPKECEGFEYYALLRMLCERLLISATPEISVVGIGMGDTGQLSKNAQRALDAAECIIGAKRAVETVAGHRSTFLSMDSDKIAAFIEEHPEYRRVAVVMSGDTGFFSGAKKLLPKIEKYALRVFPGISSLQYLCAAIHTSYDDAYILSLHGRNGSATSAVAEHKKTFVLVGGADGAHIVIDELCREGLSHVSVTVGERLSYPDERITTGTAGELRETRFDALSVLLIRNRSARTCRRVYGLPDEEFIRSTGEKSVPMTKSEVRAVSVSKLMLEEGSVVYDVGAGTGSVSVEAALICTKGRVLAVECRPEAAQLIEKNKKHFALHNLEVVEGMAPEAFLPLPAPTQAFIGGTSGSMRGILDALLSKNPNVRIVMNLVTLESIADAMQCISALGFDYEETVQISVAKSKKLGRYHLMNGQNPITIITCQKTGKDGGTHDNRA